MSEDTPQHPREITLELIFRQGQRIFGERLSGTGPKAGGPRYLHRDRAHDLDRHDRRRRQRWAWP